ncbi:hypothetical protein EEL30_15600 [Brevibacillus laterosporus]|uniref:Uncharacterized protein n=1 Tax=Brevibacillus laterosporus TaxID=1465 RepID=A0A518V9C3_BRELA|nr:hypothetical protein EEL30_15600 [Brevibacillus laterosporus]
MGKKIERTVIAAREGCHISRDLVYREFIPIINNYAHNNWFKVQNEATLTNRLLAKLDETIKDYNVERGSFHKLVRINLERSFRLFIKSRKYCNGNLTPLHKNVDEDGNTLADLLPDILVDIESNVIEKESVKEKIALLAKGDLRKKAILLAWSDGFYNDSALSELLTQLFGGKPDSHRRAITRFRTFCQAALSQTA